MKQCNSLHHKLVGLCLAFFFLVSICGFTAFAQDLELQPGIGLASCVVAASAAPAAVSNGWQNDKAAHAGLSCLGVVGLQQLIGDGPKESMIATLMVVGIGVAKEWYDSRTGGQFDRADLSAGIIGATIPAIVVRW